MKVLKKIISGIAWLLILGGAIVFVVTFLYNRNALSLILSEAIVQASLRIIIKLLICVGAVLLGLILLTLSLRIGINIRVRNRERRKMEAQKQKEQEAVSEGEKETEEV